MKTDVIRKRCFFLCCCSCVGVVLLNCFFQRLSPLESTFVHGVPVEPVVKTFIPCSFTSCITRAFHRPFYDNSKRQHRVFGACLLTLCKKEVFLKVRKARK